MISAQTILLLVLSHRHTTTKVSAVLVRVVHAVVVDVAVAAVAVVVASAVIHLTVLRP